MRSATLLVVAVLAGCGGSTSKAGPAAERGVRNGPMAFERSAVARDPDAVRRYWGQIGGRPAPDRNILVRAPDGSLRVLARDAVHPAWSRDGARIAFQSGDRIWTMGADGGHRRAVTSGCQGACVYDDLPAFSPDGRWIAFERVYGPLRPSSNSVASYDVAAGTELAVVAATGGTPRVVERWAHDPQPWEGAPAWSPDGKHIVLPLMTFNHPSKHTDLGTALFILNAGRGGERRITPWALGAGNPDWSRDGARIVFNSMGGHSANLYVVRPDGSGVTKVFTTHRERAGATTIGQGYDPAWSPDGRQITFVGETDPCVTEGAPCSGVYPRWDIYTMNADGSDIRRLTSAPQYESDPAWAPAQG
jgi:Tol biopolymer transport system component